MLQKRQQEWVLLFMKSEEFRTSVYNMNGW